MSRVEKLVRDRIPEIILGEGMVPLTRIADDSEIRGLLRSKLTEEVAEFLESEAIEELIDILEVVYALAHTLGVARDELERLRGAKEADRGAFHDRIVWSGNQTEP